MKPSARNVLKGMLYGNRSASGVMIVTGGPGSRRRARMLRITSAEWTPSFSPRHGRLQRGQPVAQHGAEDLHHLPVAVRRFKNRA